MRPTVPATRRGQIGSDYGRLRTDASLRWVAMTTNNDSAELIDRWSTAAQAYLDGDLRTYARLADHASDYTLIPPYGGDPRRGFDGSDEAVAWTARTFRGGTVEVE